MALIDAEEPPVHPTVNLEAHNDAARAHDMDVYHLPQWRAPAGSGLPCRIARQPQAGTGLPLVSQLSFFVGGLGLGSGPCYPLSLLLSEGGIGRPSGSLCHPPTSEAQPAILIVARQASRKTIGEVQLRLVARRATALAAARQHRLEKQRLAEAEQNSLGRAGDIGRVRGHAHRRLQPWRLVGPQHGLGQSRSENQERCFLHQKHTPDERYYIGFYCMKYPFEKGDQDANRTLLPAPPLGFGGAHSFLYRSRARPGPIQPAI